MTEASEAECWEENKLSSQKLRTENNQGLLKLPKPMTAAL